MSDKSKQIEFKKDVDFGEVYFSYWTVQCIN